MQKKAGFSTLELMVVIGIMVVISAVAAPSYISWRSNAKLRSAAEQLRGDLQLAKSKAVRDLKTVIVNYSKDRYFIFVDEGDGAGGSANGEYESDEFILRDRQLPAGIHLDRDFKAKDAGYKDVSGLPQSTWRGDKYKKEVQIQQTEKKKKRRGIKKKSKIKLKSNKNTIIFNSIGQCLSPQNILLVNSSGKKRLLAVNSLGQVKVIKID